jgi:hypothetical protein
MYAIVPPLEPNDSSSQVGNLQDALLLLIERDVVHSLDAPDYPSADQLAGLAETVASERADGRFGEATRSLMLIVQIQQGLGDNLNGVVEVRTAAMLNRILRSIGALEDESSYSVQGHVLRPGSDDRPGRPVGGVVVQAFEQDVVEATFLGQATTDAEGWYRFSFSWVPDRSKGGPDIWVGVPGENQPFLRKSDIVFDADRETTIDLELAETPSGEAEFERITDRVSSRLSTRELAQLNADQIRFLSQSARLPIEPVEAAVFASRLEQAANELATRHNLVIGDLDLPLSMAVYGMVRSEPQLTLTDVLARGTEWWSSTITEAAKTQRIPELSAESVDGLIELFTAMRVQQRLDTASIREGATLGDLLRTLPAGRELSDHEQTTLSSLLDTAGDLGTLRTRLHSEGWDAAKVNIVMRTINLGDVTLGHAPLVAALHQADTDERGAALVDLAEYGRGDWRRLVAQSGVPPHLALAEDESERYVDQLLRNIEQRMPSTFIAARVSDGRIPVADHLVDLVSRFLGNATTFRIGDDSVIGRFLAPEDDDLAGIAEADVPGVRAELMRVERVVRVSPTLEIAESLLTAGYSSARQISLVHRQRFIDEQALVLPGAAVSADDVYQRASGTVSAATALMLSRAPAFNRAPKLPVMAAFEADAVAEHSGDAMRADLGVDGQTATLEALFGSQDYCMCESCASMYSPSAYLVELLQMLDGGKKNAAGASALDVLLLRRPDLGEVELTCDNTDVLVPYVDLVLEVLESALSEGSFWNAFARGARDAAGHIDDWGFDPELDQGRFPRQLHDDLAEAGIDVGDDPVVTNLSSPTEKRWRVMGNGWRLHLRGAVNPKRLLVTLYPQSKKGTSTDDVIPREYVHWAYEPLQFRRYPWVFPFSLDDSETDAWLDRLKTSRREIIDSYAGSARWTELDAACAVLGITNVERQRLMSATTDSWIDWGFAAAMVRNPDGFNHQWFMDLRVVSEFRHRARISHVELLQLLDTPFVQSAPGLAGRLSLAGDECNSELMSVGDSLPGGLLTESVLRRVYLFVRLARRLGWTFVELAGAIQAHGQATEPIIVNPPLAASTEEHFTESFLVYLSNIVRLHESTRLPVEAVINLFRAKLDTEQHWDHSGSQPRAIPSYYERLLNDPAISRPRAAEFELSISRDELSLVSPNKAFPRMRLSDCASELAAALSCRRGDVLAILTRARTTVPPTSVGAGGVDGDWIDITDIDNAQVEWVVGQPSEPTTRIRLTLQEQDATGTIVDVGAPVVVSRGNNDWRHVVVAYGGAADRLRLVVERTDGAGTTWVSARVLTGAGLVDDVLTLTALTGLCGHLRLARAAKMTASDYVLLVQMSGIAALDDPADALRLLDAARRSRIAGPTVAQLDSLLRHRYASDADAAQAAQVVAELLAQCRQRLQTQEAALTPTPENAGALTRQLLLELAWPDRLVNLAFGAEFLDRTFPTVHSAPLDTLAQAVVDVLSPGFAFSASAGQLRWSAPPGSASTTLAAATTALQATPEYAALPSVEQASLDQALTELTAATTQTAQIVANAYDPLVALTQSLRLPTHQASYATGSLPAPSAIPIPAEWSGTFWYDPAASTFQFLGPMTTSWRDIIAAFGSTPPGSAYRQAVDELYTAATSYQQAGVDRLVGREAKPPVVGDLTAELLLGQLPTLADRCLLLLDRIVPVVREQRATALMQQLLADTFELDRAQAMVLLERFRHTDDGVTKALIARDVDDGWLVTPAFAHSDPAVAVLPTTFPVQFRALGRLSKLALIASRGSLHPVEIEWLFNGWDPSNGLFDFTLLPDRAVTGASPMWAQWLKFATLLRTRGEGVTPPHVDLEAIRQSVSGGGSDATKYEAVATVLGISSDDMSRLAADLGATTVTDILAPDLLSEVCDCATLIRRTGADATTLDEWRKPATTVGATRARQLTRAAIGDAQWTTASRPVLDKLRLQRRDALAEYWVQRTGGRDANDLYGELLVDAQMGPCSLTSRVRQAISSVQTFVHRILMDLEPDVQSDAIDTSHWEWMQNYRVWEANRKVLLYPENWIEPDLRIDQTPAFHALTTELLQGDVTDDAAEEALRTYVDGLGDVSRIEAVGMCNEYAGDSLIVTHVFGRTRHEPRAYFYRRFNKNAPSQRSNPTGDWTPWEQLTVDIEGDHLVPFLWRGRLFVCWPLFGEEAAPPAQADTSGAIEQPLKRWTMKLAWSEHRHGTWTARRLFNSNALMHAYLSVNEWDRSAFYVRPSVQDQGVALNIYLNPGLTLRQDTIQKKFNLATQPIATLDFDGDEVRLAAAIMRYRLGLSAVDQFYFLPVVPANDPIVVDTTTSISAHEAMTIPIPPGPLELPNFNSTIAVLTKPPRSFQLLLPADEPALMFRAPSALFVWPTKPLPFFFIDNQRQFFVYPTNRIGVHAQAGWSQSQVVYLIQDEPQLHFTAVDHPQIGRFRAILHHNSTDGLMAIGNQTEPAPPEGVRGMFAGYGPSAAVATQPLDDVVFSPAEPTGPYNWELFFHVALAVGTGLTRNHQFAKARRWFHYIFDPTDASGGPTPQRYWHFRPFRELSAGLPIAELVRRLADPADHSPEKQALLTTVAQWRDNPFEPHLVARLRPRAYMYSVVMKYLDNLIAWADQLFRRDSMEAIDEATQLYILAAQILGRRPEAIPHRTRPRAKAFVDLRADLRGDAGALGNPLVIAENLVGAGGGTVSGGTSRLPQTLYFCVPNNPKLLEYYNTVEDRLYKLRSCMNIDGVVRQLALFDPPIDPGLLVRARAAGIDLSAVLADANAPLSLYRFSTMSRTATELCSQVRELGGAFLTAVEKRDSEALARLRNEHELAVLASVRNMKELQIAEARTNLEALGPMLENAQGRLAYYVGLVSQLEDITIPGGPAGPTIQSIAAAAIETVTNTLEISQALLGSIDPISNAATELLKQALARATQAISSTLSEAEGATAKVPMNAAEKRHLEELQKARDDQEHGTNLKAAARFMAMIPDITLGSSGAMGSPVLTAQLGGTLLSKAAELFATQADGAAAEHTYRANLSSILAGYQRRAAEWVQQATTAERDIEQLTKQVTAAALRATIAAHDLRNHDLQAENAAQLDDFMRDKFSNKELYSWMAQQTSDVYFRSYQLAYDVAKRAEQAYRHELGVDTSDFIKFGYWNSLRRGLTAGEQLIYDLKRMEVSYLSENRRELEIVKNVSLRQLDGAALLRLRSDGECEFEIPEALFDLDFPGHYFRRIKNVNVSVPSVVGPYTGVNGTLTLLSSSVRTKSIVADRYDSEENYSTSRVPIQSVATSSGHNDSGLFQLDFRDDRYLPFEGAGAVSRWRFRLPKEFRPFDYGTISDLVIHLRYTARDGGETLATKASQTLSDRLNDLTRAASTQTGLVQLISLQFDFPMEWRQFKNEGVTLSLQLGEQQFPYMFRGRVAPQGAALVWDGDSPGIALNAVGAADAPLPSYELEWAADSPLIGADDPYLLVAYSV